MAYDRKISVGKSGAGALDGVLAAIVAIFAIIYVKALAVDTHMSPLDARYIAGAAGIVASGIGLGIKRYIGNWLKYRDKPAKPAAATTK